MALLFEEKIKANKPAFIQKVNSVSSSLGIDPNWLMAVMNSESGLDSTIVNKMSGATGLIQFMPSTASGLGTDVDSLKNMTNVEQLDYVKKYLQGKKYGRFEDLYSQVFYPVSIGKPDSYVIGSEKNDAWAQKVSKQNPAISKGKKYITAGDFRKWVRDRLPKSALDILGAAKETIKTNPIKSIIAVLLVASAITGLIIYINKK